MNCILIDDEADCLELLALLIEKYCPELHILGQYQDPRVGIDAIWEQRPELVFLDVDMPFVNGFGVLEACKSLPFKVIFTTAFQEYAVKAFKYSAIDYLLKPIDRSGLREAVQKAQQIQHLQQAAEQYEVLLNNLHPTNFNKEKIALPAAESLVFVSVADIVYCKADGNYTRVFISSQGKEVLFIKALKEFEEILSKSVFIRTHNSWLVNLTKVEKYHKGEGGELQLHNGQLVPVSRNRKQEVLERLPRP